MEVIIIVADKWKETARKVPVMTKSPMKDATNKEVTVYIAEGTEPSDI